MKYKAKWSGSYPCLCFGKWTLYRDGENISGMIPPNRRDKDMNTLGTYQEWHFEDWLEVFSDYVDGLDCEEWINENEEWLNEITTDKNEQKKIFRAFQKEDFRSGSCGGCI